MRDGVRPNVVCTLPLDQALCVRANPKDAWRRHEKKAEPLQTQTQQVQGGWSWRGATFPRFGQPHLSSWPEPSAAGPDPWSRPEASPPTRGRPADRAEFRVCAGREGERGSAILYHHPSCGAAGVLRIGLSFKFLPGHRVDETPLLTLLPPCCPRSAAITHIGLPALPAPPAAAPRTSESPVRPGSIT